MSPEYTRVNPNKEAVRARLQLPIDDGYETRRRFIETIGLHFDELPINWDEQDTPDKQHSFRPRAYAAFNLGYRQLHGELAPDRVFATTDRIWTTMQQIIRDPEAKKVFDEQLPNLPVSFTLKRPKSIGAIVHEIYGDMPITAVDLGAGLGHTLPIITMPDEIDAITYNTRAASNLFRNNTSVSIACGVGVDMLPHDKAVLRAMANADEEKRAHIKRIMDRTDQAISPFVQTDVTDTDASLQAIQKALIDRSQAPQVDVLITSFLGYQITKKNNGTFYRHLDPLVQSLLKDGGVWIEVGREMGYESAVGEFTIDVHEKRNNQMKYLHTPLTITDEGEIIDINESFFQ